MDLFGVDSPWSWHGLPDVVPVPIIDASNVYIHEVIYEGEKPETSIKFEVIGERQSPFVKRYLDIYSGIADEVSGNKYARAMIQVSGSGGWTNYDVVFRWSKEVEERGETERRRRYHLRGLG